MHIHESPHGFDHLHAQAAADAAAAQEQSLASLNVSLQSAVETRVANVKAELLARIEALSHLQQVSDLKTAAALQRQEQRVGVLHEEALASVDAGKREVRECVCVCIHGCVFYACTYTSSTAIDPITEQQAAERLREKISGVEATMQESHMQLSQRLSSAVQRVRASARVVVWLSAWAWSTHATLKSHYYVQVALSEVRGVERHDLLKALLKEVSPFM